MNFTDCECSSWARCEPIDLNNMGDHHHRCVKYETEKIPRLFYWEEAEDAWVPAPDKVENIIDASNLDVGDDIEIRFRVFEFTGAEMNQLPES